MQEPSLTELLDSVGINKSILAKLLDVSRSTVMRMKDDVSDEVLAVIDKYKADMTLDQSEFVPIPAAVIKSDIPTPQSKHWTITHKNIALSRIKYGRKGMDIKEVAGLFGLSVFDYNQAVRDTVNYCNDKNTSFKELRQ